MDLADSSGDIVGKVIFEEGDNCRTELDRSAKKEVKIHKPPSDWTTPETQRAKGGP